MTETTLPPRAPKKFGLRVRSIHGDHFDDGWDWLRNEDNAEVLAHLDAENAWADEICAPTAGLAKRIAAEVKGHAALDDVSVPVREGDFWYFHRWREGASYATHHRVKAIGDPSAPLSADSLPPKPAVDSPLPGEQLVLDENEQAAGHEFFRVADIVPSPDGRFIAWARDLSGDERYQWLIREVASGKTVDEAVVDAGYGFAWAADSASFIYVGVDDAWRACEIWHHSLGTTQGQDRLLLVDPDERFEMGISTGADPNLGIIASVSSTSGKAWAWSPFTPCGRPLPIVEPRPGVMVSLESAGDHFLIVHTASTREGSLAAAPIPVDLEDRFETVGPEFSRSALGNRKSGTEPAFSGSFATSGRAEEDNTALTPGSSAGSASNADRVLAPSSTWICLREPEAGERILDVEAYGGFCVLTMRSASLTQLEYRMREVPLVQGQGPRPRFLDAEEISKAWGPGRFVETDVPVRTIQSINGPRFHDEFFRFSVQSQIQPPRIMQVDPRSGEARVLKVTEAPGWDASAYVEERVWVRARDQKTQIPVTLVHRADIAPDGTNPGWELGYGAYEVSYDPEFEILRLPLLKRGVVFAIAHVRGGGELGRAWYEDGKEFAKPHSFTDFIDVGEWLVSSGWVHKGRLIGEGRSAGGLLMGAVTNTVPDRYRVIVAGVPFVDALTTILDPSLPLTIGEWEEWGNPIESPEVYALMRGYTPYENVPIGVELPAVMATTSVNDTRVEFVEPTKWVLRLREASGAHEDAELAHARPIVLRTQMVAGHAGPSGREGHWAARAEEFAFALGQVGIGA